MNNLIETLAWELVGYNIHMNCLSLEPVSTETNRDIFMKDPERDDKLPRKLALVLLFY